MKVHLVDGTFELFRTYYGAPSTASPSSVEVGATRALLRSYAAMLGQDGVTHIAAAYDTVIESFRNDLFDGYKTGGGIEPELWAQFPLAERATFALGITCWSMIEFEADDAIATGATRYAADDRVEQIVICSPDKDLMQCVRTDRIVSYDRIRSRFFDHDGVIAKFGIEPESIPDYLALVGDSADGIPGLPRWGAKSASTVLAHYHRLEDIPGDESTWAVKVRGASGLGKVLRERRDDALLYKQLATLRTDVPLEQSVDDLEWRGARRPELEQLCEELGETALLGRIARWQS
jgi:5'-3' exonuclease